MERLHAATWVGRSLPAWSRERVFAAAYNDLFGDYVTARVGAGAVSRLGLRAVFEARALLTVFECWRLLLADRFFRDPLVCPSKAAARIFVSDQSPRRNSRTSFRADSTRTRSHTAMSSSISLDASRIHLPLCRSSSSRS